MTLPWTTLPLASLSACAPAVERQIDVERLRRVREPPYEHSRSGFACCRTRGAWGAMPMVFPNAVTDAVFSSLENMHVFTPGGAWVWSWLGPGCCNYVQVDRVPR